MIIYNTPLQIDDRKVQEFVIMSPTYSKPIHIGKQGDAYMVWCEMEKDRGEPHRIEILKMGTGVEFGKGYYEREFSFEHLNTIQDGPYVWHFYYRSKVVDFDKANDIHPLEDRQPHYNRIPYTDQD
jgi:hypothetical protein